MSGELAEGLERPTLYFVGVSTASSSIMQVFPRWSQLLGIDAEIRGYDAPLDAPDRAYRRIVEHIRDEPLARGALVTSHKLDLYRATRDLFDEIDPYAQATREISCISKRYGPKRDRRLRGHAKDPVTSGLALDAFLPSDHLQRTGGEVLCFGAGGAAVAISVQLASRPVGQRPARMSFVEIRPDRLDHLRAVHARLERPLSFEYLLGTQASENDRRLAALPPGSLVINATGMGKDRPGSPLTDAAVFPQGGYVWELNYRGSLDFLHQAQRQRDDRALAVEDGWVYFLHGWSQVIAEVFDLTVDPATFRSLDEAASALPGEAAR